MRSYPAVERLLRGDQGLLFAYDHGFEYGPENFDERSAEPVFALELANSGSFTGFICQKGIAARYYDTNLHQVPLIVKLNGKTSFRSDIEPKSILNCSVDEAISYGAAAVGYVIHVGSQYEPEMIAEFGRVEREAHAKDLAVLAWMYIAGDEMIHPSESGVVAYAARVGMELNADGLILRYTGDRGSFSWVVKNAGHCKVFVVGGPRMETQFQLLDTAEIVRDVGGAGFAIGRNIWQSKNPINISERLAGKLFS